MIIQQIKTLKIAHLLYGSVGCKGPGQPAKKIDLMRYNRRGVGTNLSLGSPWFKFYIFYIIRTKKISVLKFFENGKPPFLWA